MSVNSVSLNNFSHDEAVGKFKVSILSYYNLIDASSSISASTVFRTCLRKANSLCQHRLSRQQKRFRKRNSRLNKHEN